MKKEVYIKIIFFVSNTVGKTLIIKILVKIYLMKIITPLLN